MRTGIAAIVVCGVVIVGVANQANAGSRSMLDPYDGVQASSPAPTKEKKKNHKAKIAKTKDTSSEPAPSEPPKKLKSAENNDSSPGFLTRQTNAVGHDFKATGHTIASGTKAASEKVASASKSVGHGVKATGEKIADGSKAAGGKLEDGLKVGGKKVKSGTQAVGSGVMTTAVKVKDGTKSAGKKIAALPGAVGSRIGKLFGHNSAPRATAQTTTGGTN